MFEISFALSLTDTGLPRRKARSRRSAFARFTRYSASDIAPAIATAVASSREKIFWTTLDPTKNPFEARLSAARTTPSLLRIPTVVVMSNLRVPMSAVGYVDWNIETSVTTCSRKRGAALSLRSTATYPTLLRLLTNASRIKATPATSTRRGRIMGTGGTGWQGPVAMHPANTRSRIAAKPPRRPKPTPVRSSLEPRTDSAMTRDMIRSKGKPCRPYHPYNSPTGCGEAGDALVAGGVVDGNGYRRVTISRDFRRLISR